MLHVSTTILQEELIELSNQTVFTTEQISKLYARFKYLDRSGSGLLSASHLLLIPEFKANPLSSSVIEVLEDLNNYDLFNFNSFLHFMQIFHKNGPEKKRKQFLFKLLNRNGDGKICSRVLKFFYHKMHGDDYNEEKADKLIESVLEKYGNKSVNAIQYEGFLRFYEECNADKLLILNF